jgi:hypothetical protein
MPLDPSQRVAQACNALAAISDTQTFRSRFPSSRLLRSAADIEAARQNLPATLLPFMLQEQPGSTDVYAFDLDDPSGARIVVWNDHAVVADWPGIAEFLAAMRSS